MYSATGVKLESPMLAPNEREIVKIYVRGEWPIETQIKIIKIVKNLKKEKLKICKSYRPNPIMLIANKKQILSSNVSLKQFFRMSRICITTIKINKQTKPRSI